MTSLYVMPKKEQDETLACAAYLRQIYNVLEPGPALDIINHQLFVMRERWLKKHWTAIVEGIL